MNYDARDCIVREVDIEEEKEFLNINHKHGYVESLACYGLYYNEELIELLSLCKPRYNSNYQWELIRDCTKQNYIVEDGISKLWGYFVEQNNPRDVICYTYKNTRDLNNRYIDNCGFINISRAKPTKKIYFEGKWNGELIHIDKSVLECQGVDRLLNTKQGHDRTNEQILLDLGFEKKEKDGYSPQIDSWFCGGCVYRMEIIGTDKFYIGQTIKDINNYWGSGSEWNRYLDSNNIPRDNEHIRKIVLKDDFLNYKDMIDTELTEIHKYCINNNGRFEISEEYKGKILNVLLGTCYPYNITNCPECGGSRGSHKRTCSRAKTCPECGGKNGTHFRTCSRVKICSECGHLPHIKTCSKYVDPDPCPECGKKFGHKKFCSKYKAPEACSECGGRGTHKQTCSKAARYNLCPECGGRRIHKKTCSLYPENKRLSCEECGGLHGQHRKGCSKYSPAKPCPECGISKGHKSDCSHARILKPCPECGSTVKHKRAVQSIKILNPAQNAVVKMATIRKIVLNTKRTLVQSVELLMDIKTLVLNLRENVQSVATL